MCYQSIMFHKFANLKGKVDKMQELHNILHKAVSVFETL